MARQMHKTKSTLSQETEQMTRWLHEVKSTLSQETEQMTRWLVQMKHEIGKCREFCMWSSKFRQSLANFFSFCSYFYFAFCFGVAIDSDKTTFSNERKCKTRNAWCHRRGTCSNGAWNKVLNSSNEAWNRKMQGVLHAIVQIWASLAKKIELLHLLSLCILFWCYDW